MKKFFLVACLIVLPAFVFSTGASALTPDEIIEKASLVYYYGGDDGTASVKMTITDRAGRVRVREVTMLRRDVEDGGAQKYYVYFRKPPDVAGMVFMVWKNIGKGDDRWLYLPAIDLVKRVAAKDKRSSFAGSHFTYEDVSGRAPGDDTHEFIVGGGEEEFDGRPVFIIKNTPKDADAVEFSYYVTRIDRESFMPLKAEYFDRGGKPYKTMVVEEVQDVQGIPTVVRARAVEEGRGETLIEFTDVGYNIGLKEKLFTERYLRKPPRKWIK
ncbi:MAG: outer membrane lipoprotein-sorting protein [Thermodesulfobacteriota bacterium]